MDSVQINAYAKINLFLEVVDKKENGYHNIDSVMQTVTLCDAITLTKSDTISLTNNAGLPNDNNNLAYKAAVKLFEYAKIQAGAKIDIDKKIPVSAGLAGGSADAAAVLRGLNELYELRVSEDELCALGASLGADVPFCIKCGTIITKGIGDVFYPCSPLPECYLVISKSGEGVSTPYAYGQIDILKDNTNKSLQSSDNIATLLKIGDIYKISSATYNVFEEVVCKERPLVNVQKNILKKHGALTSMMSGSGPSVFGIFTEKYSAKNALRELKDMGAEAHLCKPYNP